MTARTGSPSRRQWPRRVPVARTTATTTVRDVRGPPRAAGRGAGAGRRRAACTRACVCAHAHTHAHAPHTLPAPALTHPRAPSGTLTPLHSPASRRRRLGAQLPDGRVAARAPPPEPGPAMSRSGPCRHPARCPPAPQGAVPRCARAASRAGQRGSAASAAFWRWRARRTRVRALRPDLRTAFLPTIHRYYPFLSHEPDPHSANPT
jgi:hypothetical protein